MSKKWGLMATLLFAVALAGMIIYSAIEVNRGSQLRHLKGFINVDVEAFFKDPRVQKILEDHGFKIEGVRIGSRDMAAKVSTAPDAPRFFIPSGVLAAQMIKEAAKKLNLTATTYNPFYSPLVIASWGPVAQILVANGVAVKSGDRVYDLDLCKLLDLMLQKKRWNELPGHESYDVARSVLIATADPRTASSGAMYLALVSQSLNGNEVVTNRETARKLAGRIAELFTRQGFKENYVNSVFDDYLSIGMGKVPLGLLYEYQPVSYAMAKKAFPAQAVLLYPKPTLFGKEVFVALNEDTKELGDLLSTNPELQRIAVEYGFRGTNSTLFKEMTKQVGFAVKEIVVDVVDPPASEIMDEMIAVVTEAMK
ncbi:MAG: substrate-binding domain-containing protein [Candidatus Competibacteraceae bacterium]